MVVNRILSLWQIAFCRLIYLIKFVSESVVGELGYFYALA